jgi:hypothetical protein
MFLRAGLRIVAVRDCRVRRQHNCDLHLLCVYSTAGLQSVRLGAFEQYGKSAERRLHRAGRSGFLALAPLSVEENRK